MELEDKIRALKEEFKDLPKVLIRSILCSDDINEDLAKATDRLEKFKQKNSAETAKPVPLKRRPLRGGLYVNVPAVRGNRAAKSWTDRSVASRVQTLMANMGTVTLTGETERKAPDPPKPKPKPRMRRQPGKKQSRGRQNYGPSQRQYQDMEEQVNSSQQQLRWRRGADKNIQLPVTETDGQLIRAAHVQRQWRENEIVAGNLRQRVTTLERQLRTKSREMDELQTTLTTAQQTLREYRLQEPRDWARDWVVTRDDIQITDKLLGRGAWGRVVEGKYCGCAVAVKQIHDLIISAHNRSLFEREMDIASRCRHPCLLQFIGATNDEGNPLFVTELMESSLRALLEERSLSATEVSVISLDVARALIYLHRKKPTPIIHRDVSSANVLLWRQGNQWRAKVADYGTANFMQQTMTVAPGAVIYTAPEALTSNQTVKVDVYSFGVLLCEMCIRELPDPTRRNQQIATVTNRVFRALIRGCVQTEPGARSNMEEIIEELEELV